MKGFQISRKGYKKQYAMAYAAYMMAGSYFLRTADKYGFGKFRLHYAGMPRDVQYELEDRVVAVMERMDRRFLSRAAGLRCEASARMDGDDVVVTFGTGGFEGLECRVHKNGSIYLIPTWG